MKPFGEGWSDGAHLLWNGQIGDTLETAFDVEQSGSFAIEFRFTKAPDYGRFDIFLSGQKVASNVDLYSPTVTLAAPVRVENISLDDGEQKLSFKLIGHHKDSKTFGNDQFLLGLDYIHLTRIDPPPSSRLSSDETSSLSKTEAAPLAVDATPFEMADFTLAMKTHCYDCHSDADAEGEITLDGFMDRDSLLADIKTTQRLRNVLHRHEMPPEDEPQPSKALRSRLVATLESIIDSYSATHPNDVPVVMRRMNRYEYSNAVRDLLRLKGDIYPLPEKTIRTETPYFDPASGRFPRTVTAGNRTLGKNQVEKQMLTGVTPFAIDLQSEGGFNNRGSELSVSPILLESFLSLGRSIVSAPEFESYCQDNKLFSIPDGMSDSECIELARERLKSLLERAFRRPVDAEVLDRYHQFFRQQLADTNSFRSSMKSVVAAVLASPKFIYLSESPAESSGTADGHQVLSSWELATRLSFFLWSTIPDDELLATARDNSLVRPEVLDAQVKRMLEHPRSQALSQNFARQWLRLDQLIAAVPDFDRFENYYARIGCEQWKLGLQSMLEPLLLFESIMVEDRSIMLLVDSNYTYRSNELQSWYEDNIPFDGKANRDRFNTHQQQFRRKSLDDRRHGGVITSTATLTMTSAPLRTSPIVRGAWFATVIFNQPPPPPPDDVPSIEADDKAIEAKGQTLRERLVEHQANQSCASCHAKIDPLGFALENYDAVGRWRDKYGSGLEIDTTGTLFGDANFDDVVGLKDVLLENPEWFMRAFCEHMLSYAVARELEVSDELAIDKILSEVIDDRGQFTTVVREIVRSQPFRYRGQSNEASTEVKP